MDHLLLTSPESELTAICPVCKCNTIYDLGTTETLIGHYRQIGHDHNPNCRINYYKCAEGHKWSERLQNICTALNCDWKGKEECFCHPLGVKIHEINHS